MKFELNKWLHRMEILHSLPVRSSKTPPRSLIKMVFILSKWEKSNTNTLHVSSLLT